MSFQIHALSAVHFAPMFSLTDAELVRRGARRVIADACPGFPCRVSLEDAAIGEELLLLNFQHLSGATPYAASHAIYVRKGVPQADPARGAVPRAITSRLLSIRGFGADQMMIAADVVEGAELRGALDEMFEDPAIGFIDLHHAKQGCYAARVTRA